MDLLCIQVHTKLALSTCAADGDAGAAGDGPGGGRERGGRGVVNRRELHRRCAPLDAAAALAAAVLPVDGALASSLLALLASRFFEALSFFARRVGELESA